VVTVAESADTSLADYTSADTSFYAGYHSNSSAVLHGEEPQACVFPSISTGECVDANSDDFSYSGSVFWNSHHTGIVHDINNSALADTEPSSDSDGKASDSDVSVSTVDSDILLEPHPSNDSCRELLDCESTFMPEKEPQPSNRESLPMCCGAGMIAVSKESLVSDSNMSSELICPDKCDVSDNDDNTSDLQSPRPLTHTESQASLDKWKSDILLYLAEDANFTPFLDGCTWTRSTRTQPLRGLCDDPPPGRSAQLKLLALNAMLALISRLCPVITPRTICYRTTSLDSIWQLIYAHFDCLL
jgi:hypothetical protein